MDEGSSEALVALPKEETENKLDSKFRKEELNDRTFLQYLLLHGTPAPETRFSDALDLGTYTEHMDHLYATSRDVPIYTDDERLSLYAALEESLGPVDKDDPKMKEFIDRIEEKGPGERSLYIYADYKSRRIRASDIRFGEFAAVHPQVVFEEDHLPLMLMHTHPTEDFFSPQDLVWLLTGAGGVRKLCATLVLCPDTQILAVAGSNTPILDYEEGTELINDFKAERKVELEEATAVLDRRLEAFDIAEDKYWRKDIANVMTSSSFQALDEEGQKARALELFEAHFSKSQRLTRLRTRTEERKESRQKRSLNGKLVEFARKYGIELYYSRDKQNFTKFSA